MTEPRGSVLVWNIKTTYSFHLTELYQCGMLTVAYRTYAKGGSSDHYGLFNRRGGSYRASIFGHNCKTDASYQRNARLQVWRRMAHRPGRVRRVEATTQKSISETSRGLTDLLVFPVAHVLQRSLHTPMQHAV